MLYGDLQPSSSPWPRIGGEGHDLTAIRSPAVSAERPRCRARPNRQAPPSSPHQARPSSFPLSDLARYYPQLLKRERRKFGWQRVLLTIVVCMSATPVPIQAIGARRQVFRDFQRSIESGKRSRRQLCCLRVALSSLSLARGHKFQVADRRCIRGTVKNLRFMVAFFFAMIGGAAATPSDGAWEVRLAGAVKCPSDWIVELTVDQGRLSGVFQALVRTGNRWARGRQAIENFVLKPDGRLYGYYIWVGTRPPGSYPRLDKFLCLRAVFRRHSYSDYHAH